MIDSHSSALEQRARILIEQRRFSEASDFLRQSLAADPENVMGIYLLAICQSFLKEEKKIILETIHRGLAVDSEFVPLIVKKASVLIDHRQWKEALGCIETAVAIDPEDSYAFLMQAHAYLGLDRFADAEAAVRMSLERDPDNQDAGNLLARILRLRNKNQETDIQVESLLAKDPNDAYTHANAGWIALEKSDLKMAKYHFLEALRLKPDFEYARQGIVETFKAESPLYRLYLQYSFKMMKLGSKNQIALIIGFLLISKFASKMFPGIIGTTITSVYLIFVLWSWVANGVGNLFLLTNSFARRALLTDEILEAFFVGGVLVAGVMAIIISFLSTMSILFGLGMVLIGSVFPSACTFTNKHTVGQKIYGVAAILIVVSGGIGLFFPHLGLGKVAYLIFFVVMWLGAFNVMRRGH